MKRKLTARKIKELYWKKGLSTRKIAAIFGTNQRAIIKQMKALCVKRRSRIDAVVKGTTKYVKRPFSGNLREKAYMLGVGLADFRRRKHGYQIDVSLSTTHPHFTALFKDLFQKYAPVRERPYFNRFTGRYGWKVETCLHPSFEFLLFEKHVPNWVMRRNVTFLRFLAGYTDGEGTISVSKNGRHCVSFVFALASEDFKILSSLRAGLKRLGFTPALRVLRRAGDTNTLYGTRITYKKNHYGLRMKRRKEVVRLLKILPIRHPEKMAKKSLILRLSDKIYISDFHRPWAQLKTEIKDGVGHYISEAEALLRARKSTSNAEALA